MALRRDLYIRCGEYECAARERSAIEPEGRARYFVTMPMRALACNYSGRDKARTSSRSVDFAKGWWRKKGRGTMRGADDGRQSIGSAGRK